MLPTESNSLSFFYSNSTRKERLKNPVYEKHKYLFWRFFSGEPGKLTKKQDWLNEKRVCFICQWKQQELLLPNGIVFATFSQAQRPISLNPIFKTQKI